MPIALLLTVPAPVPAMTIESVRTPTAAKTALTVLVLLILRSQGATPLQVPPDQWLKAEPGAGVAIRVTLVLEKTSVEQVLPQSIPTGELVTVPLPVPPFVIVSP
jgi:hypothetical protein